MKRYRVPGWNQLLLGTILAPIFVILLIELSLPWRHGGTFIAGVALYGTWCGAVGKLGSRLWVLVTLPLAVFGVLLAEEVLPEGVREGVLFASIALIGASYTFWQLVGRGLSSLLVVGPDGVSVRGTPYPWDRIDGFQGEGDVLRICFTDGTNAEITKRELGFLINPELMAPHLAQLRGRFDDD